MKEVQKFLNEVFQLEKETLLAKSDIDLFNKRFNQLIEYSNSDSIRFGLSKMEAIQEDPFGLLQKFSRLENNEPNTRNIFKISMYSKKGYGPLFACYVSISNPIPKVLSFGTCYIVGTVEGQLKILTEYFFSDTTSNKAGWNFAGGDRDLVLNELGKPIEILRLLEPKDDPESMEDYMNDH